MKKLIITCALLLILCLMQVPVYRIESAKAEALATIYILSDGNVSPATPLIQRDGNSYTFTGDINASIVVQKSSITIDGNGYLLYGNDTATGPIVNGFTIAYVNDVTILNVNIKNFTNGIWLHAAHNNTIDSNYIDSNLNGVYFNSSSSQNIIKDNTIINCTNGVKIELRSYNDNSNENTIQGNNLTKNVFGVNLGNSTKSTVNNNIITSSSDDAVFLQYCQNNTVSNNDLMKNKRGIRLYRSFYTEVIDNSLTSPVMSTTSGMEVSQSSYNTISRNDIQHANTGDTGIAFDYGSSYNVISENNISRSDYWGIDFYYDCYNNTFHHNNIVENSMQVRILSCDDGVNFWDDGAEGNYWSDYQTKYPNASEIGSTGIGDTPYVLDANNEDRYPLMDLHVVAEQKHDVSVLSMVSNKKLVSSGYPLVVSVTVKNSGDFTEDFNLTIFFGNVPASTRSISGLAPGATKTLTFVCSTHGFLQKTFTLRALANPVAGELQVLDNSFIGGADFSPATIMDIGYCIVVLGDIEDHSLLCSNNGACEEVFRILRDVGYSGERIYYLGQSEFSPRDIDGDSVNDVDNTSTLANFQWAIEHWAAERCGPGEPLFIFMHDHGIPGFFSINEDQVLGEGSLASWLDNLENATHAPIYVIYSACFSGSFIDNLSESGRVIITSSMGNQSSWTIDGGREIFQYTFWKKIRIGHSLMSAFNWAWDYMQYISGHFPTGEHLYSEMQTPLLDDNGDGVGNTGWLPNGGDGNLAVNVHIGGCEWAFPWISYAVPRQTFALSSLPDSVTLWAKVENETSLANVTAWMMPPDWVFPNATDELGQINLEYFEMSDIDGDGNWSISIPKSNFTDHISGPCFFNFFIVAEQENGDTSLPQLVLVEFTDSGLPSDDDMSPLVSLEYPLDEKIVHGTVRVNGTITDDMQLDRVELYVNNSLVDTIVLQPFSTSYFEFNFDTTTLENDPHIILVKAYDAAGNNRNQSITVYTNNFVHDIIVTDITSSMTPVNLGDIVNVSVTVANHGAYTENFNITLYANSAPIGTQAIALQSSSFTNVSFAWDTSDLANGNYTLSAYASPVTDETDTINNLLILSEEQSIIVISEFPAFLILALFIVTTLLATLFCRRRSIYNDCSF